MKLDQLVFSLRKYCQNPKPYRPHPDWEPIFPLKEAQMVEKWEQAKFLHLGRILNRLKDQYTKQDPLRSVEYHFLLLNVPFEGFKPRRANIGTASRTAAIRRVMERHQGEFADTIADESETGEVLEWVVENFGLSSKTRKEIKALLAGERKT